jgi:hypothetical protein
MASKPRDRIVNLKSSAGPPIHPQRMTTRSRDLRSFAYTQVTKMLQEKSSDE